ncbi:DUF4190 domain-containing protein [Streptomyces yokosukanensis]|uniref:DUF4190 domain-containing protein n=1 Tax=Streptomyces yokosukanensis TaxID=67386 RepID=UPI00343C9B20
MSDEAPLPTPQENRPAGASPTPPRVSLGKGPGEREERPDAVRDAIPESGPDSTAGGASLHYQQTLTSLPAAPDTPAVPSPWAPPAAGSAPSPANPFAPPAATPPLNPYAPPAAPATPYASQPPATPYAPPAAQYAGPEPVPPPPIAPDGPGQVPYGYPGAPAAYGYPGRPQPPYAGPYPSAGGYGYGWPGTQPMPSNGMGTASLVLGILAAVCFLLWPVALVLGVLAIIFGALGRGKAGRGEATNPGMALAGLICGGAGIVLAVGFIALVIAAGT